MALAEELAQMKEKELEKHANTIFTNISALLRIRFRDSYLQLAWKRGFMSDNLRFTISKSRARIDIDAEQGDNTSLSLEEKIIQGFDHIEETLYGKELSSAELEFVIDKIIKRLETEKFEIQKSKNGMIISWWKGLETKQ